MLIPTYPGDPGITVGDWVMVDHVMSPLDAVAPTQGFRRKPLAFMAQVLDVVDPYIENNQPDAPIRYLVQPLGWGSQTLRVFQPHVKPLAEYNLVASLEGWPTIEAPGRGL